MYTICNAHARLLPLVSSLPCVKFSTAWLLSCSSPHTLSRPLPPFPTLEKYNRKVWTVDPVEMNAVWIGERVAVPNVAKIKANTKAMSNGNNLSEDSKWGPNRFFCFPSYGGTGGLWANVTMRLPHGWFHFNQKVISVDVSEKRLKVDRVKTRYCKSVLP